MAWFVLTPLILFSHILFCFIFCPFSCFILLFSVFHHRRSQNICEVKMINSVGQREQELNQKQNFPFLSFPPTCLLRCTTRRTEAVPVAQYESTRFPLRFAQILILIYSYSRFQAFLELPAGVRAASVSALLRSQGCRPLMRTGWHKLAGFSSWLRV